jgi:hypothetical protein
MILNEAIGLRKRTLGPSAARRPPTEPARRGR